MSGETFLTSVEIARVSDGTYRQVDLAVRRGLVPCVYVSKRTGRISREGGSGYSRRFTVDAATAIVALVAIRRELTSPGSLSDAVERHIADAALAGHDRVRISRPGVVLEVDLARFRAAVRDGPRGGRLDPTSKHRLETREWERR